MENFLGEIRLFAGNYAPQGWNLCDGSLLSLNEYTTLFALIGTTFGGDGQTTFGVPDLRGRVPVHIGAGAGLTPIVLGAKTGTETVSLTAGNLPSHSHTLMATAAAATVPSPAGAIIANTVKTVYVADSVPPVNPPVPTPAAMNNLSISAIGGSVPVPIVQPSFVINYIIAVYGIYPPQN